MPVKLSDELVKLARREAEATERSITAQIEHWAKLGRSVETALRYEDVVAVKRSDGDLQSAFSGALTRQAIYHVLQNVAAATDRSELARTLKQGRIVYQSGPSGSGSIVRIEPDGTRTRGRFEQHRFVAARQRRARVPR